MADLEHPSHVIALLSLFHFERESYCVDMDILKDCIKGPASMSRLTYRRLKLD